MKLLIEVDVFEGKQEDFVAAAGRIQSIAATVLESAGTLCAKDGREVARIMDGEDFLAFAAFCDV